MSANLPLRRLRAGLRSSIYVSFLCNFLVTPRPVYHTLSQYCSRSTRRTLWHGMTIAQAIVYCIMEREPYPLFCFLVSLLTVTRVDKHRTAHFTGAVLFIVLSYRRFTSRQIVVHLLFLLELAYHFTQHRKVNRYIAYYLEYGVMQYSIHRLLM